MSLGSTTTAKTLNLKTVNKSPLIISIEAISGKGEDAQLFVKEQAVTIGVFDGLGGKPAGFDGERGGRIASRQASIITEAILRERAGDLREEDVFQIQEEVCKHLKQEADSKIKSRIKGSLTQRLCTTLALVSIPDTTPPEHLFELSLAWIGDSRIYFLSPEKGLQQLTKDDLKVSNDAFKLIREDSPMSQHITADMPPTWRINFKVQKIKGEGCVIACTDGCFQCLNSPWAFEKLLLDTLAESNTVTDWQSLLAQRYEEIKQDDVSLVLYPAGFDFDEFKYVKSSYQVRLDKLNEHFHFASGNYDDLLVSWDSYRLNYEEMLTPNEPENNFHVPAPKNNEVSASEDIKSDDYRESMPIFTYTDNNSESSDKRSDEGSSFKESQADALKSSMLLTEVENKPDRLDKESDLGSLVEERKVNDTPNNSALACPKRFTHTRNYSS